MKVSELIKELKKIPNQEMKVFRMDVYEEAEVETIYVEDMQVGEYPHREKVVVLSD